MQWRAVGGSKDCAEAPLEQPHLGKPTLAQLVAFDPPLFPTYVLQLNFTCGVIRSCLHYVFIMFSIFSMFSFSRLFKGSMVAAALPRRRKARRPTSACRKWGVKLARAHLSCVYMARCEARPFESSPESKDQRFQHSAPQVRSYGRRGKLRRPHAVPSAKKAAEGRQA